MRFGIGTRRAVSARNHRAAAHVGSCNTRGVRDMRSATVIVNAGFAFGLAMGAAILIAL